MIMSKEEIVNAIQNLNDEDDFVRLEAESTISMYMPAEIDVLHEEVLNIDYPKNTRLTMVELLRDLKDPSSMDVFVKLLNDRNKWIRRQSSSALADYGEDAVEPLLTLVDDENWRARGGAVWALAKIARPDTLDVFLKAYKDEKSFVRSGAVFGLGNIGGDEAVEALKYLAENDESGYIKANALTFLDKLSGE
ncbi:HEAT repeat domain-containing protein [Methanosphaera sp. ISO3-F5]|uniref:HEAT repeat domain-containing protein n=1 Tax=Methanosphaera sp. ISO3-F5 TaxID=1452353 RepID=UPI002B26247C|nr:HEAT repeat domain-containing protein [Methanosphaera sp. ISO3-F5]WQH65277.1 HEAT repeat domain-containing protein [Methanosphaera sp. ISO3-F5]